MPFPTTAVLDDCTRADEDPLSLGGHWTNVIVPGNNNMMLQTNLIRPDVFDSFGSAYWNTQFAANQEGWMKLSTDQDAYTLYFRLNSPNTTSLNGYSILCDAAANQITVRRHDSSSSTTTLGAVISTAVAINDQVGISMIGSTITIYVQGTAVDTRSDATYGGAGYIGVRTFDTGVGRAVSQFGGGSIVTAASNRMLLGVGS